MAFPSSYKGLQSFWIRAPPLQLHLTLITSMKGPSPILVTLRVGWGLHIKIGVGTGGDTIQTTTIVIQTAMLYHPFLIIVTLQ